MLARIASRSKASRRAHRQSSSSPATPFSTHTIYIALIEHGIEHVNMIDLSARYRALEILHHSGIHKAIAVVSDIFAIVFRVGLIFPCGPRFAPALNIHRVHMGRTAASVIVDPPVMSPGAKRLFITVR